MMMFISIASKPRASCFSMMMLGIAFQPAAINGFDHLASFLRRSSASTPLTEVLLLIFGVLYVTGYCEISAAISLLSTDGEASRGVCEFARGRIQGRRRVAGGTPAG